MWAQLRRGLETFACRRGTARACPVCNRTAGRFRSFGASRRAGAQCPWCGALERHRLLWLYLRDRTDLLRAESGRRMLHVAPEPVFAARFAALLGDGYLTADLADPRAMLQMDVTDMPLADASIDVAYCSHVLEHVPDDRKAMREFFRVLRPGGDAILLVPITAETTIEDPTITDPAERRRLFGQEDHVRSYGPDYADRLRETGFEVTVTRPEDFLTAAEIVTMGITAEAGEIHHCRRPLARSAVGA